MRVHGEPRYLLTDSISRLTHFVTHHPFVGSLILLAIYIAILEILKWWFEEIEPTTYLFAVIIWVIVIVLGSAAYTFFNIPGFHFGG